MIFNDKIKVLWSIEFIQKFETKWNWESLSSNKNLPWSIGLIEKFKCRWDWKSLSSNKNLPWSIELITSFENKWDWEILSSNKSLPWSTELFIKFENNWNITKLYHNENFPWSEEIIDSCISIWDWKSLSSSYYLPWSIAFIDKYKNKLDRNRISSNTAIKWTFELLNKYNWNWDLLSENRGDFWSIELIEHFKNKWNWLKISSNPSLPWSKELIKQFGNNLKFNVFYNKNIKWSNEFLEKRQTFLFNLEPQPNSPLELLENYDKHWFETESVFCDNLSSEQKTWLIDDIICDKFIKWNNNIENVFLSLEKWLEIDESEYFYKLSTKIINKDYNNFCGNMTLDKWEDVFWKKISASNKINFTLIDKFQNELDWNILSNNSSLNWTIYEMNCFANHLSVEPNFWTILQPHLNLSIVDSLLQNAPQALPPLNFNFYKPYSHTIFSVIPFGKYKGKTLYEIISIDNDYVNWCIVNLNHFYINDFTLNAIKIFYPDFDLSQASIKALEKKNTMMKLNEYQIKRDNDYDNDNEKPQTFEDWLDTEFGDEAGTAYWNLE